MLLHEYMKKFRNKYNMTQRDLARELNVSYDQVVRWESRKEVPDLGQKK